MRRLGGAAAAAAVLVLLTGCGSQAAAPTATPTVTVVETPSASASTPPATSSAPSSSAPSRTSSAPASVPSDADANRPQGQCDDDDLGVSVVAAADGGAAGSEHFQVLFTNTGGSSCVLRGTPGVSVVGDGNGTQLGQPADRDQSGVKTVRLAAGGSVAAPLSIVDIRSGGGPLGSACAVKKGDGYRVYPPHSTRAFFYQDSDAYACTSSRVFMTVGPVAAYTP